MASPLGRAAAIAVVAALGCRSPAESSAQETPPSPQASAMPAPLAAAPTPVSSAPVPSSPEAGPPPSLLRGDLPLPGEPTLTRETAGYTLAAVLRQADVPTPPRAPEVNAAGLDAARKKTELKLTIDLAPSRMRIALVGSGWVLPSDTELRARSDHFGHVVVWPGTSYRPLAPGALRALIGERRFDVAPLTHADLTLREEQGKRIAIKTRKADVSTRAAKASVEIGRLTDLGEGGVLLCRALLDLMNAPPSTPLCAADELPMRAEFHWTGHGSLVFEVTGVLKKPDLPGAAFTVPPQGLPFAAGPPPAAGVQGTLTALELAALRSGPVDVPSAGEGLMVVNATDQLRVLWLDGVPVAWAAAGAREALPGLTRGRYVAQWRTFLGDQLDAPSLITVPGSVPIGGGDAGTR